MGKGEADAPTKISLAARLSNSVGGEAPPLVVFDERPARESMLMVSFRTGPQRAPMVAIRHYLATPR